MKVKIGNTITNPNDEPIALIFETPKEVESFITYISESLKLNPEMKVWTAYPSDMPRDKVKEFVKDYISHE